VEPPKAVVADAPKPAPVAAKPVESAPADAPLDIPRRVEPKPTADVEPAVAATPPAPRKPRILGSVFAVAAAVTIITSIALLASGLADKARYDAALLDGGMATLLPRAQALDLAASSNGKHTAALLFGLVSAGLGGLSAYFFLGDGT